MRRQAHKYFRTRWRLQFTISQKRRLFRSSICESKGQNFTSMELAEILHPGLGAIMDPILNLDKPEQPGPSTHATDRYPTDRTNIPIMIGEIPPVPTPLMGAIRIRTPGGPEVIEYRLVAAPKPGPHEVLIRVVAASMNEFDSLMRKSVMSIPPGEIVYPGVDCSGVVAAVGPGATRWQLGDEVCYYSLLQ